MSKCDNCSKNCCGHNFVGLANAFKQSNSDLFNQILLSEEEVEDIVKNFGDEYIEYIDNMPFMALNKDRSCKAFKDGKCSIYNSRPDVCKLYPYYFDPFGGIFVDKNCTCFEDDEAIDKKEIFELINKRIKLFATIEGKKHELERAQKEQEAQISKKDLYKIIENLDFLRIQNNKLYIDNINTEDLINKYKTNLAVAYTDIIERRIKELQSIFNSSIKKHNFGGKYHYVYATKANYFSEVVCTAANNAGGLEFSSEHDIDLLLKMIKLKKFDRSKFVVCNGVINENYCSKIAKISSQGVKVYVVIDDEREYENLKKLNLKNVEIGLRYHCQEQSRMAHNNYHNFELDSNRFGFGLDQLEAMLKQIQDDGIYNCSLLLFHFGGEITNERNYLNAFETVCDMFASLKSKYHNLKFLDFGGGFPSRLSNTINLENLVDGMVKLFKFYSDKYNVIFDVMGEHGRHATEEHGVYLFKIDIIHHLNNQKWAIINNSLMKQLPDLWGLQKDFIILPINNWDKDFKPYFLAGNTCDEDDRFVVKNKNKQILLPDADDLYVAVLGIGAYQEMIGGDSSFSHCMSPKADELVIHNGKETYIKNKSMKEKFKRLSYTKKYLRNFKNQ